MPLSFRQKQRKAGGPGRLNEGKCLLKVSKGASMNLRNGLPSIRTRIVRKNHQGMYLKWRRKDKKLLRLYKRQIGKQRKLRTNYRNKTRSSLLKRRSRLRIKLLLQNNKLLKQKVLEDLTFPQKNKRSFSSCLWTYPPFPKKMKTMITIQQQYSRSVWTMMMMITKNLNNSKRNLFIMISRS